ncbi:Uncharacterised protein [Mycobacteroides abscessus subsp. abscessus]|nr:Uncharacterised protein [Mycobacteroides abscessus subsp. abscessus]
MSAGIPGHSTRMSGGGVETCWDHTLNALVPVNTRSPVSNSCRMSPRAYRSVWGLISRDSICSGAMKAGVPMVWPVEVYRLRSASRATASPKSSTFSVPLSQSIKIRCRWVAASTAAVCAPSAATIPIGSRPRRTSRSSRVTPSTNSITR